MVELNIKSETIEKGLDLAKEFLGKLIGPIVEEVGLLAADNIKYIRFKRQVKTLNKASEYAEKHNIKIKGMPIKILVPLLEHASLEDDEPMQDKWATLLGNMADSEQNLQNHVFPYILSQLSIQEYEALKSLREQEKRNRKECNELSLRIKEASARKEHKLATELYNRLQSLTTPGLSLDVEEEYQEANLLRLGVIRAIPPPIYVEKLNIGGSEQITYKEEWIKPQASYDGLDDGVITTELGDLLLKACEPKG
jgi:hypothetical protein